MPPIFNAQFTLLHLWIFNCPPLLGNVVQLKEVNFFHLPSPSPRKSLTRQCYYGQVIDYLVMMVPWGKVPYLRDADTLKHRWRKPCSPNFFSVWNIIVIEGFVSGGRANSIAEMSIAKALEKQRLRALRPQKKEEYVGFKAEENWLNKKGCPDPKNDPGPTTNRLPKLG
ncbi:hypothetical protein HAX54_052965 [Datura stramonium]|uniref:DRBM domain-containing protein n=1 Tax=Datura stramonium TaxID=4076 RepID=A0ABS8T0D2_DATST|nr:hypothetical protein [Datura stramonium]